MKLILVILLFALAFGCASRKKDEGHPSGLNIVEVKPNKWTAITKQNLLQLTQVYDLRPFLFTRKVKIQSRVIPHSHPVLTLNTRNAENPHKLLSVFLHEQLHWWLTKNPENTKEAVKLLKKYFPKAPVTKSLGADSTHLHLLVCYLELKALSHYMGKKEGREVVYSIMKKDKIYPWIYYQVLFRPSSIEKVVKKFKLLPPPLT